MNNEKKKEKVEKKRKSLQQKTEGWQKSDSNILFEMKESESNAGKQLQIFMWWDMEKGKSKEKDKNKRWGLLRATQNTQK